MERINVKSITDKMGAKGAFWVVDTGTKKFSIFDSTMANNMKNMIGKSVMVELQTKGQYTNMITLDITSVQDSVVAPVTNTETPRTNFVDNMAEKNAIFLVSYAKDIVVAYMEDNEEMNFNLKTVMKETTEAVLDSYEMILAKLKK